MIAELESAFKFNDAVIRKLVIRKDAAETAQSPLFKAPEEDKKPEYKSRRDETVNPLATEDAEATEESV